MQLQIFKFEEGDHFDNLTTVEINGEAWFVATEVCRLLDIKNVSDAVSRLGDDEKLTSVIPIAAQKAAFGSRSARTRIYTCFRGA